MLPLKVALVTAEKHDIPDWVPISIENAGIELTAKRCKNHDELLACAGDAQVIWTFGHNDVVTADILPMLKTCKAIMRSGSGLDDIPVEAAKKLGIKAVNTPEAIAETVAEHAVSLLFALVRQIPQHDAAVKNGSWDSEQTWAKWHVPRQTLGLIGFGLIAQHVVKMLKGFDMKVLAFDPYADEKKMLDRNVTPASFERVIKEADLISVHCPLTKDTHHLIGESEFKAMKDNALLINTSRGAVIDEAALVDALKNSKIAGAALDVTEVEPPAADNPLFELENVIITPHIAAFSDEFEKHFWTCSINALIGLKNENTDI